MRHRQQLAMLLCNSQFTVVVANSDLMSTALFGAITRGDIDGIVAAIQAGSDVNSFEKPDGDSALTVAVQFFECPTERHTALHILLTAGADPKLLDKEFLGPLFCAMLAQDAVALQILLAAGADPSPEHRGVGETLYEAAEFDYLLETWMMELPEEPLEADKASEDAWLWFLTRIAAEHGKPTPDCMSVLWSAGACRSLRK